MMKRALVRDFIRSLKDQKFFQLHKSSISTFHVLYTNDYYKIKLEPAVEKPRDGATEGWRKARRLPHHIDNIKWREEQGLPFYLNSAGPFLDKPDYSFVDGRPAPYTIGQKRRILEQQEHTKAIIQFCKEVDYGKERYQQILQAKEDENQRVIQSKLKPKGNEVL